MLTCQLTELEVQSLGQVPGLVEVSLRNQILVSSSLYQLMLALPSAWFSSWVQDCFSSSKHQTHKWYNAQWEREAPGTAFLEVEKSFPETPSYLTKNF